jgi:hypothetical protein
LAAPAIPDFPVRSGLFGPAMVAASHPFAISFPRVAFHFGRRGFPRL